MRTRLRRLVAISTLVLHAVAPVAAYATVRAAPGQSDVCSVVRPASTPVPGNAPANSAHDDAHCASCPGGSAAAAMPPRPACVVVAVVDRTAPCGTQDVRTSHSPPPDPAARSPPRAA